MLLFTSKGLTFSYGKPHKAASAHIHCITSLPVTLNCNPNRFQEFYEKLIISVQALQVMKKLKDIKGDLRLTLEKLPSTPPDLVRLDFCQLVDSLRRWTERSPKIAGNPEKQFRMEN